MVHPSLLTTFKSALSAIKYRTISRKPFSADVNSRASLCNATSQSHVA
jgi:hypothetical protein